MFLFEFLLRALHWWGEGIECEPQVAQQMLDYLIAVAVALIGLVVVYTMFTIIDSKESVVVKTKPSSPKKPSSPAKPTKKERKAQREEDEIIAKELALATTGMHTDKRNAKVTTLDEYRSSKKEKLDQREKGTGPVQTTFSPKQVEMDKEQGFSIVKREAPKKKEVAAASADVITQKEALDRKLGQFFRASGKKSKGKKDFLGGDEPTNEGGKVVMRGSIAGGRTW